MLLLFFFFGGGGRAWLGYPNDKNRAIRAHFSGALNDCFGWWVLRDGHPALKMAHLLVVGTETVLKSA